MSELTIYELARLVIMNDRAISSGLAKRLAEFVLEHEPKPLLGELGTEYVPEPTTEEGTDDCGATEYEDDYPNGPEDS